MTELKKSQTSPDKVGYFNYGPEKLSLRKLSLKKLPHSVPKGPLGLVQGKVFPAQTKKKKKIGTIFWEQTFRFVTPKGPKKI
jgi:hypothetical protein